MFNVMSTLVELSTSSTLTKSELHTICPDETVYIHCSTNCNESDIIWTFPIDQQNTEQVSFFSSDDPNRCTTVGTLHIRLDHTRPLKSHIEIPYSSQFNNTTFVCGISKNNNIRNQTFVYVLSGKPFRANKHHNTILIMLCFFCSHRCRATIEPKCYKLYDLD